MDKTIGQQNKDFESKLREVECRLQSFSEKKTRELDVKFRKELENRVKVTVTDCFKVPSLIGKDTPYSTFANFISSFHQQVTTSLKQHRS